MAAVDASWRECSNDSWYEIVNSDDAVKVTGNAEQAKVRKLPTSNKPYRQTERNWLEIPSDVMMIILSKTSVSEILENAQKVCTTWRQISKEPAMWRAVSMDSSNHKRGRSGLQKICRNVVDRSQGQLVDISINDFCDHDLLRYITDRSSQLRRLKITNPNAEDLKGVLGECLKKLPLLEELSLRGTIISGEDIKAAGRFCPLLKTLKYNDKPFRYTLKYNDKPFRYGDDLNKVPVAIGKYLPELRHLYLIKNGGVTNVGLSAILDGCRHLESLYLNECWGLQVRGDLGVRCCQQIKHVQLPGEYDNYLLGNHPLCLLDDDDDDDDDDDISYYDDDDDDDDDPTSIDPDNFYLDFDDLNDDNMAAVTNHQNHLIC